MADKKVEVRFDTTADTKGAEDAEKAINEVNDSSSELMKDALKSRESLEQLTKAAEGDAVAQRALKQVQKELGKEFEQTAKDIDRTTEAVEDLTAAEAA
ncbi:hypothetical protein JIN85_21230, partial [Luteolibacter pohnpeiensis]